MNDFIAALPADHRPETTDGYEGYIYAESAKANPDGAELKIILRSFSQTELASFKKLIQNEAATLQAKYSVPITVTIKDQYQNMKSVIDKYPQFMDDIIAAYRAAGVEPTFKPIRGGTDGARLSFMGIPTPNVFDGAHDFHSRSEYLPIPSLEAAEQVILEIIKKA